MTKIERYKNIIDWFSVNMPDPKTELDYTTPFELLVAVILSAQCTDKRVNMVTKSLFQDFPTPKALAQSTPEIIIEYIKSISYPANKSKHLIGMAQKLESDFGGIVPNDVDLLQTLPGVGRKTANVVASVIYDIPAMAVDTHVFRVSERIGLTTSSKTPLQTETELVKNIPSHLLPKAHHWLILHGRYVCTAKNPKCATCGIKNWCRKFEKEKCIEQ
jgi:endonuclease III